MPLYSCIECCFSTKLKTDYKRHLKTKKHYNNIKNSNHIFENNLNLTTNDHNLTTDLTTNDHKMTTNFEISKNNLNLCKQIRCEFCDKNLSTKGHLARHQKLYCKKIKSTDENKLLKTMIKEQQKTFENERANLYKHIEKLLEKVGNTTINNTQTNNIQLNNYGKENLSHITDSLKNNLIKAPYGMIPKLIEAVHFSDEAPENKNIALTNKNDNKIKVFTGNKWVYKNKEETISDLVDGKYFILDAYYSNAEELINIHQKDNYQKFKTFFDEGDKELHDKLKQHCELILLNNR